MLRDVSRLLQEGQAQVALLEEEHPANTLAIPDGILVYLSPTGDKSRPWIAYLEDGGKRAIVHSALTRAGLHEAISHDESFGPAAARYYRLWRTLKGYDYGSEKYQTKDQAANCRRRGEGALSSLLAGKER